jgi:hypothetical protein
MTFQKSILYLLEGHIRTVLRVLLSNWIYLQAALAIPAGVWQGLAVEG